MRYRTIVLFATLVFASPFWVLASSSIEDESTPVEQEDLKTLNQVNGAYPIENSSTPIERSDTETINQINQ